MITYLFHLQNNFLHQGRVKLYCVDLLKRVLLFCLGYFSVFPLISLCGHQSLILARLCMKWLDPILRSDRSLFCTGGSDGYMSELMTGCSLPRLLRFWSLRGHQPLLSSFCRWSPTRLVLGRGRGSNWFLSHLWFCLRLLGAGCTSPPRNRWIKRKSVKFIASSHSADRWSNLALSGPDRSPECGG